jgi:serine/threonine protein kinase
VAGIRAGQRYGQWVISGEKPLGEGGNGQVWRAEADDGRVRAIKVLSAGGGAGGRYRLGGFRDEIAFLRLIQRPPASCPCSTATYLVNPGEASWYVMPVARPIREALGSDPDLAVAVGAVGEIAATLASLAAEGVAHRDIKPDNLFELDGRWAVGDFGLVTYPDKDPRTQHGRKLGPVDYMAPEMRQDAHTSAGPQAC